MKMLLKRIVKFVVLEYPEKIVFYFFENIFKFFPLQNKIVFDNFIGRGYGDDPKYIASYLLKSNSHIRCYWVIKSFNTKLPERIVPIKYKSIRYLYHMCTAKVWIDNVKRTILHTNLACISVIKSCRRKSVNSITYIC